MPDLSIEDFTPGAALLEAGLTVAAEDAAFLAAVFLAAALGPDAVRVSASRPGMGLVTSTTATFDRDSACGMTQEDVVMGARRARDSRPDGTETRA